MINSSTLIVYLASLISGVSCQSLRSLGENEDLVPRPELGDAVGAPVVFPDGGRAVGSKSYTYSDGPVTQGYGVGSRVFDGWYDCAQSFTSPVDAVITAVYSGFCLGNAGWYVNPEKYDAIVSIKEDDGGQPGATVSVAPRNVKLDNLPYYPDYKIKKTLIEAAVTAGKKYWLVYGDNVPSYFAAMAFVVGTSSGSFPDGDFIRTNGYGDWLINDGNDMFFKIDFMI